MKDVLQNTPTQGNIPNPCTCLQKLEVLSGARAYLADGLMQFYEAKEERR